MKKAAFFVSLCFIIFLLSACSEKAIKIGLLASFSGPDGEMGREALNGIIIAVDNVNKKGGIKGKKLELIAYDDKNSTEGAAVGARNLIDSGVSIIIGPFLSSTVSGALDVCNKKKIALFSPTVASTQFENKDDMLIRLSQTAYKNGSEYPDRVFNVYGLKKIKLIWDLANKKYSEDWKNGFVDKSKEFPDSVVDVVSFNSNKNPVLTSIVQDLSVSNYDAIVFVANSFYTASLSQQIKKIKPSIRLFTSEWGTVSQTELISIGGTSVEGMEILTIIDMGSSSPGFLFYKDAFFKRFNSNPQPTELLAYETAEIIIKAFELKKMGKSIKDTIIKNSPYKNVFGNEIIFNKFGDANFDSNFFVISSGKLKRVSDYE